MNMSIIILTQLAIYASLLTLLIQHYHFLMALLSLESIMLTTVLFIPMIMYSSSMPIPSISIILLTFGACEASLGLGLMVTMSRSYGSDMLSMLSLSKC